MAEANEEALEVVDTGWVADEVVEVLVVGGEYEEGAAG